MKLPKEILLSELLNYNVKGNGVINYGNGENVWMHPPVHRILGWYSRPSNFDLKRNVWRLNQISQIIDNEIYVKGDPAISDLATLNRFPNLIEANLINVNGSKIGVIADFLFEMKTGKIKLDNSDLASISADAQDIGNANELIPVSYSGENFDIAFNVRYLLEGLKVIASENVLLKCNIATTPAVFVPEDNLNSFTYLVMPVQVRS